MRRPPGRRGGGGRGPRIRKGGGIGRGKKSSGCALVLFMLAAPPIVFGLLWIAR